METIRSRQIWQHQECNSGKLVDHIVSIHRIQWEKSELGVIIKLQSSSLVMYPFQQGSFF